MEYKEYKNIETKCVITSTGLPYYFTLSIKVDKITPMFISTVY